MNWLNSYTASWKVVRINQETWEDASVLEGARHLQIERDCSDDVPMLETGTLTADVEDEFEDGWYRIYMTAKQGASERIAVATLLFEQSSLNHAIGIKEVSSNGFSVLKPASDRLLSRGSFAQSGANGAELVRRMLEECTPAPIEVDGSFTIVENIVFDVGATYLDACWSILNAGGWCMQIDGYGCIHIIELPNKPALNLDSAHIELIQPGVLEDADISEIPNRYYAVEEDNYAVAENIDETPRTSYEARGRWVERMDSSPVRANGESLEQYAKRKLIESSQVTKKYTYTREYWPDVLPFSMVATSIPRIGVMGDLRVISQSLECGNGIIIQETAGQEVRV